MNATGGQHSHISSDWDISNLFNRANLKKSDKSHRHSHDTDVFFLGLSFRCFHRVNCSLLVLSGLCPISPLVSLLSSHKLTLTLSAFIRQFLTGIKVWCFRK